MNLQGRTCGKDREETRLLWLRCEDRRYSEDGRVSFRISCRKGTYIRSFARDLDGYLDAVPMYGA